MNIIVKDNKTGKELLIKGDGVEFMIYRKAEGVLVDGKLMTKNGKELKNEWRFTGLYPNTLGSAVYHCMNMLLTDPDDKDAVSVEAEKARVQLGKIMKARLEEIEAYILKEVDNA